MTEPYCVFCDRDQIRSADLYIESGPCVFFATRDAKAREDFLPPDVLPGSGAIIPTAHRAGPFALTPAEWVATHDLLAKARAALHEWLAPDGYTLGWNDQARLHAHLHVIPRFRDEPLWNQGVRSAIKLPENRRPDPWAPGNGEASPA